MAMCSAIPDDVMTLAKVGRADIGAAGWDATRDGRSTTQSKVKALVWFWLIDKTLSANLVYQSDYEIGSTTPSDEAMAKIMTMVMAW